MKRIVFALTGMSLVILSGCVTISSQEQAAINESIPVCNGEIDCDAKWAAARRWVSDNTNLKIQISSDNLIETQKPDKNSSSLAARITKEPSRIPGLYEIVANVWCDNNFGCEPQRVDALMDFNKYVNSAMFRDTSAYKDSLQKNNYSKPVMGISLIIGKPIVKDVYSGSPAEKAGIKNQDLLTQMAGKDILDLEDLKGILREISFGEEVEVTVMRESRLVPLKFKFPSESELQKIKESD